jgi:hypothetical protein
MNEYLGLFTCSIFGSISPHSDSLLTAAAVFTEKSRDLIQFLSSFSKGIKVGNLKDDLSLPRGSKLAFVKRDLG